VHLHCPRRTGFHVDEQSPIPHAKAVRVPTLVAQVHDDTYPSDVQAIYDNIAQCLLPRC
jgi:hypothetical protein